MTITNTKRLIRHQGNGVATSFPYDFLIPDAAYVVVQVYDDNTGTTEVISANDYGITGIGNVAGGQVEYPLVGAPLPSTKFIIIKREVPYTQEVDITNQGGFFPEVLEDQLDLEVMQIQQLAEEQSRFPKLLEGDTFTKTLPRKTDLADRVMAFDAQGEPALGPTATEVSNAQASATAAAASAAAAAASFDELDDIYLGAKTSDPTLDNDGNALQDGALYFNTTDDSLRTWNGTVWRAFGSQESDKGRFTGDGVTTSFDIGHAVDVKQVFWVEDGIPQEPDDGDGGDFTMSGTSVVRSQAPADGAAIFWILLPGIGAKGDTGPQGPQGPQGEGESFNTKADAEASSFDVAPEAIRLFFLDAANTPGSGGLYRKALAEPSHAGKFAITLSDGATVVWYENADAEISPEQFGGDRDAAATAALALSRPFYLRGPLHASVTVDPGAQAGTDADRWAYFKDVLEWQAKADVGGDGLIELILAEGLHPVDGDIQFNGWRTPVRLKGPSSAETRKAVSMVDANISANLFTGTIDLDSAAPAYAEIGGVMIFRNFVTTHPTSDFEALNGAVRIKSITGDRLRVGFDFHYMRHATDFVSPGADIDSRTHAEAADPRGLNRSEILFCRSNFIVNGIPNNLEGFINVENGSKLILDVGLGIAFPPTSTVAGAATRSLIFVKHDSYLHLFDGVGLAGAPEIVLRAFGNCGIHLNRSGIGGADTAETCLWGQSGPKVDGQRMVMGICKARVLLAGTNTELSLNTGVYSGGLTGAETINGGCINLQNSKVNEHVTALRAAKGDIYTDGGTQLEDNDTDITLGEGGKVFGAPARDGVGAVPVANVETNGGVWYRDTNKGIVYPGGDFTNVIRASAAHAFQSPSIPAHGTTSFTISMPGVSRTTLRWTATVNVNAALPAGVVLYAEVGTDEVIVRAANVTTAAIAISLRTYNVAAIELAL